jgi:hypothetical protein
MFEGLFLTLELRRVTYDEKKTEFNKELATQLLQLQLKFSKEKFPVLL